MISDLITISGDVHHIFPKAYLKKNGVDNKGRYNQVANYTYLDTQVNKAISEHFKIQQTQVYVVGSAKLGFSISPNKRFKDMDEDSDIDVAIIDEKLFDEYWKRVYSLNIDLMSRSENDDFKYRKFVSYLFKGWVRPDCFPLKMSNEWFEYFKGLYGKYNRKVAVGIYRDNDFFMGYHRNNILKLREEIRDGV